jgi:phosphoribosylformylglycinamidine synthase
LNFGNPEKPEIMAQLAAAIDGIAEACTALGTPITGGNVSLYNETKGVGIYPTPVVGVVGIIDDVTKAVPSGFQRPGDEVLHLFSVDKSFLSLDEREARFFRQLGSSEFARVQLGEWWGEITEIDLAGEAALSRLLVDLAASDLISSANDVGSGGLATCLARCATGHGVGADIDPMIAVGDNGPHRMDALSIFQEDGGVVVTCTPENKVRIESLAKQQGLACMWIGKTNSSLQLRIHTIDGTPFINLDVESARQAYSSALEDQLAAEVVTA